MRKILTFMVSLVMVSCGSKSSRTTDSSQTNDSIYTIENINNISLTQPEKALALLDTIEQRKLLKPNDINGLRAVIYHNGMDQSNVALKYAKNKDVVVCASDLMAIGAMNALIDMDIFRPVCGFDGITLMGYVGKQMNTIRQDFYSISSRAVEEVHHLMNGGEGHQVVMPHSIVKMYYKDIIC